LKSFDEVTEIDCRSIDRSSEFFRLIRLNKAMQVNLNEDQVFCYARWPTTKKRSDERQIILTGLTLRNGVIEDNQRIKSIKYDSFSVLQ
jgi:hypothetical protein